ncbi:MAG: hypothetical protein U1E05_04780, partial [Patescibacteria group bacterium]|nr:hypothetical protein [Patescibacteria group bacterium]
VYPSAWSILMKPRTSTWRNRAFVFGFCVLTLLCWSPAGYGTYGPAERLLGVPDWAGVALGWAARLFVLEWVYLFRSSLAMNDGELPEILSQLRAVDLGQPDGPVSE